MHYFILPIQKQSRILYLCLFISSFISSFTTAQPHEMLNYTTSTARHFERDYRLHLIATAEVDLAIRYKEGRGIPLVFVHGSWDDHHSWLEVAVQLATAVDNPIVLYDRRGHSASAPDIEQGTISADCRDLYALLQKLGFDQAHIIGHSYGANIAIQLTNEYPETAASLLLYEPPVFGLLKGKSEYQFLFKEMQLEMSRAKELLELGAIQQGTVHFIEKVAFGPGSWMSVFNDRARHTMLASYRTWLDQANDPERLNLRPEKLLSYPGKITLISGNKSLPIYPAVVKELQALVPQAQTRIVDQAGHGGLISHSKETAKIILEHLR